MLERLSCHLLNSIEKSTAFTFMSLRKIRAYRFGTIRVVNNSIMLKIRWQKQVNSAKSYKTKLN